MGNNNYSDISTGVNKNLFHSPPTIHKIDKHGGTTILSHNGLLGGPHIS